MWSEGTDIVPLWGCVLSSVLVQSSSWRSVGSMCKGVLNPGSGGYPSFVSTSVISVVSGVSWSFVCADGWMCH